MQVIECARKFWFCCGHRIVDHENKCSNPHGHNYTMFVHARSNELDNIGRVIDFSVLKSVIDKWIDTHWDHAFLIYEQDTLLMPIRTTLSFQKPAFICKFNPTAENMAKFLLNEVFPDIFSKYPIKIFKVELWESENNRVVAALV